MSTTFTDTDVNNCFRIYNTDTERLVISFNTTKKWLEIKLMRHAFVFNCPEVNSTGYLLPKIIKPIGMHEKHYSLVWYIKIMNTAIIIIGSETIKADF